MPLDPELFSWTIPIDGEAALPGLAAKLAPMLAPGIPVTLSGGLGAGKTAFARALLRHLSGDPALEVPSPTFSIVQEYQTPRGPVSHFDLYRLSGRDELDEIGLEDALGDTITLIEWPELAAPYVGDRVDMDIVLGDQVSSRVFTITGRGRCADAVARLKDIQDFLDRSGWGKADRTLLHGDASTRSYELLEMDGRQAIFMNAPARPDGPPIRDGRTYSEIARLAEGLDAFCAIAVGLRNNGFQSPEIFAQDLNSGFLILDYFGTETILDESGSPVIERYEAAVDILTAMRQKSWSGTIPGTDGKDYQVPNYADEALLIEAELLLDWYFPTLIGAPPTARQRRDFVDSWSAIIPVTEPQTPVWCLRDFHSPNLHWLAGNTGFERIGLIDFQDAVLGHPAYDLVSLLQDARVTVPPEMEARLLAHYLAEAGHDPAFDPDSFLRAYAVLGAQRNTKILGIFIRLARRDGKTNYLKHLPRIATYLARNLKHPALTDLAGWFRDNLPQALAPEAQHVAGRRSGR